MFFSQTNLDINKRKISEKSSTIWKQNNTLPNHPWVKEKNQKRNLK